MNIYRLSIGYIAHYVAATDEDHARVQGSDSSRFPGMSFLPFNIELVEVPDHYILVATEKVVSNADALPFSDPSILIDEEDDGEGMPDMHAVRRQVERMGRDELVDWLKRNDIKHHHNLGDDKLRELIINHVE